MSIARCQTGLEVFFWLCWSTSLEFEAFPRLTVVKFINNFSPSKKIMARPVTLFTGQWADLPLKDLAPLAKKMGFDGLELACWGDHLDRKSTRLNSSHV